MKVVKGKKGFGFPVVDSNPCMARSVKELVTGMGSSGFQATKLVEAARISREIFSDRECFTFLSFTANMVASGLRGAIAETIRRGLVDAVVTTGGAIDHDFIKSFEPYFIGDFNADDAALHRKGVNRLGNVFIPTARYELFEKKVQPVFERVCKRQKTIAPSRLVAEMAGEIRDKNSFLYWCRQKKVPVYSPCLIDSALGLQLHFFRQDHPAFVIDELADLRELAPLVLLAKRTGAIVLGGGPSKHFTIASNILRGGLDKAVYVTTASEWDGSLSGAETREAKSWGKIKEKAREVTVHGDATILYPLLLAAAT